MVDESLIERVPLFAGIGAAGRRELAARAVLRDFAPGQTLWRAGGEPRGFFVVVEGEVRVVRTVGERTHVLHTEDAGGTLGEVPLFEGGRYPATAEATRRTRCIVVGRDALGAAMREDPELAFVLLGRLAARVRHLIQRLDQRAGRSVTARLAEYLVARSAAAGTHAFTLGRTQLEVAEELGTVRVVVVRTLRELREAGIIAAAGRGRITIRDPDRLRALAGE